MSHDVRDGNVAEALNVVPSAQLAAQSPSHRRPGVQKIDVAAAGAAVARRGDLFDMPILACPARSPLVHLKDSARTLFTH